MGHRKWHLIDNNVKDFNEKIERVKQSIHDIMGIDRLGAMFYKRFLIRKQINTK